MSPPWQDARASARVEDFPFARASAVRLPILSLDIPRYVRLHATFIAVLVVLNLVGQYSRLELHHDKLMGFVRDFNLDDERNVPTWFQSTTLCLSAVLLEIVARVRSSIARGEGRRWRVLAIGFLVMSLDEAASFHERLQMPLAMLHNVPGFRAFSWVVPGVVLVTGLLLYFLPWIRTLPARTRNLMLLAGAIYVGGAVGLEAVGGIEAITIGLANWIYVFTYTVEETCEMTGVLLLLYALLDYLRSYDPAPVIRLSGPRASES